MTERLERKLQEVPQLNFLESYTKPGVTTDAAARIKQLEKEVSELRKANEILKAASVFFAKERDRP